MIDPRRPRSVPMTMRAAILLTGLALLGGAGCGGDEAGVRLGLGLGGDGGSEPARLSEAITFELIGGDAFRDDEMTVQADGRAQVETRSGERSAKLTPDELSALAEEADVLAKAESALTEPPRPDALSYRFTYGGKQVETDSGAMPEALEPLIGRFIRLVDRYGAK